MKMPFWLKAAFPKESYRVEHIADPEEKAQAASTLWKQYGEIYHPGEHDWAVVKVTANAHDGTVGDKIEVQYSEFVSEVECEKYEDYEEVQKQAQLEEQEESDETTLGEALEDKAGYKPRHYR